MLSGAFRPPQPKAPAPAPVQAAPPPQQSAAPRPAAPNDMVVSWDEPVDGGDAGEIKTVVLPAPKRPGGHPGIERPPARHASNVPAPAPASLGAAPRPPAAPAQSASPEQQDALLRAFLTAAGIPDLKVPGGLTPELMTLIGELTREALRGTLDLLLARALTKREVRAQATMIAVKENNPLKFSPTVEAALTHMFAPHGQGFMAPVKAVRDAYNDLRSHQFGFMAGMRAALEGVVSRFDPANLEQRLTRKSMLGSIMPSARRAQLWELYEQLYREISKEAEDDFQKLFGREFLRAYEAQIEKLEQEDAANRR
jgi:FHA domain-containing protein